MDVPSRIAVPCRGAWARESTDIRCALRSGSQPSERLRYIRPECLYSIPFKWVMKSELRRLPLVGKACEAAHFIFVDETRVSSIAQTIEDAKKVLATGNSIFIFPEGSRTETGRLTRFKKGAFVIASELDVPILPVTIDGAFEVLPRGTYLPHPRRVVLTVHPAFHMSEQGTPPAHIPASARLAQQTIASALPAEG